MRSLWYFVVAALMLVASMLTIFFSRPIGWAIVQELALLAVAVVLAIQGVAERRWERSPSAEAEGTPARVGRDSIWWFVLAVIAGTVLIRTAVDFEPEPYLVFSIVVTALATAAGAVRGVKDLLAERARVGANRDAESSSPEEAVVESDRPDRPAPTQA